MVLPIGFFAPLPLPMMIPFMGIQSAIMAEQFGTMFQYGKRRISAMSNEEFNKMTPDMLQARITTQIQGMIPEMEKQIQAMRPMVIIIMKEFAEYVRLATEAIAKGGSEYLEHAAHGHIFGHGDTYVSPSDPVPTPETGTPGICPSGSHWDSVRGQCIPDNYISPVPTPISPTPDPVIDPESNSAYVIRITGEAITKKTSLMNLYQARITAGNPPSGTQAAIDTLLREIMLLQEKYKFLTGSYYSDVVNAG